MPAAARPSARAAAVRPAGRRLLRHDRALGRREGVRFLAGADEAGRGALAGPLVCAAVLFDLELLDERRRRTLDLLDDSKKLTHDQRECLYGAVLAAASAVAVRVIPAARVDGDGLHASNLHGLRACVAAVAPADGLCLIDYFKLGADAPRHLSLPKGDATSAAIAAASIVAKVTRDRLMHRLDAPYPQYGFADHVGYITRAHEAAVRAHGPCPQHRLSFAARCLQA